jgi:hypothetical protein
MLVYKNGTWNMVELPAWLDPSWGEQERAAFATKFLEGKRKGHGNAIEAAEAYVYSLLFVNDRRGSASIAVRKEHRSPENEKK